tara:strand:- start:73 stop:417 length:345 start_codon:yes stop_codon:yes gene_type:complete
MNKLSSQDETKIILFIKDWIKLHGYSQKDLSKELKLNSSRTSEISKKIQELYKKGGLFNLAKNLIAIEQKWLNNNPISETEKRKSIPYNQLDIDYKIDIDALMDQMKIDHNSKI